MQYKMGVDGISVSVRAADDLHNALVIAASWNVETRVKEYMIAFLLLETLMLGVFMALDLVLFYVFFEAGLIPMFLIIGIWGGANRIYASLQVLPLYLPWVGPDAGGDGGDVRDAGTTDIPTLMTHTFGSESFSLSGHPRCWRFADADVLGLLCQFRGENADVAGAYMVAGRACSGSDSRLCRAGGDPC